MLSGQVGVNFRPTAHSFIFAAHLFFPLFFKVDTVITEVSPAAALNHSAHKVLVSCDEVAMHHHHLYVLILHL